MGWTFIKFQSTTLRDITHLFWWCKCLNFWDSIFFYHFQHFLIRNHLPFILHLYLFFSISSSLTKLYAAKPPYSDAFVISWFNRVVNNDHSDGQKYHTNHKQKQYNLFLKHKSLEPKFVHQNHKEQLNDKSEADHSFLVLATLV